MDLAQAPAWLAAVPDRLADAIREAGPEIEVLAVAGVRQGFAEGVSPDGTPFAPLAHPRPQGGGKPLRNTGLLAASVSASCTGDELALRANAPGARLHQEGGTVRPTRAKALAIPVTPEAVRAGSARRFPRRLFALGAKAAGKGKGALAESDGRGGVKVHYLLRQSVDVPARPYLGVSEKVLGRIGAAVAAELAAALAEA